jgi:hypothetical protein
MPGEVVVAGKTAIASRGTLVGVVVGVMAGVAVADVAPA